jgi:uncharacterized damage-inducible protein DinB
MAEVYPSTPLAFPRLPLGADAGPVVRRRDVGSTTQAPMSIRLAQALHHGTDHRSQICTALTSIGIEPPFIDVWDYGVQAGTVRADPPTV